MKTEEIKTKICLLGDTAVGKTSLIRRYVLNMFDDKYIMTLGTKVSKKTLTLYDYDKQLSSNVTLMIWDITGQKGFRVLLHEAYFKGAKGALMVCDLTRKDTLESTQEWVESLMGEAGVVPILFIANKSDLMKEATFGEKELEQFASKYKSSYIFTSAKTGENVEKAFRTIAEAIIKQ